MLPSCFHNAALRLEFAMIYLVYLPVNAAYAFVLGSNVATAQMFRVDGEPLFFASIALAEEALRRHGLKLDGMRVVANEQSMAA